MKDTTQAQKTQTMRGRAIEARKESDRLWEAVKTAEAEMLPAKRKYETACAVWAKALEETRAIEMAADAMEGKR